MPGRDYMGIPREKIPWRPTVDPDKCIGCGECLSTCPNEVYVMNEELGRVEVVNPGNCVVLCDKCAEFCEQGAISFPDVRETKKLLLKLAKELEDARRSG